MKFRYKVLIINIILLSIGIGTVGFFMIDKNFKLALDSQIKNAIEENNMIQSTVEYQLLDAVKSNTSEFIEALSVAGTDVTSSMSANQSAIYIVYDGNLIYTNSEDSILYPDELWMNAEIGTKNYVITDVSGTKYIFTSSCSTVLDANLNIINRRDITSAYRLMEQQIVYFRFLLVVVVLICSICMFAISIWLTRPLEYLNRVSKSFGEGNYDARADVKTHDEIGSLACTYNQMAQSVSDHVDELKDMIVRQDQFVADFTHELKTPMTSIIGYADTIRSKEMTRENQIMAASYIFSEGKRLESMSRKLLDFIYTKQHSIASEPFHTGKLVEEIAASVNPALKEKNIHLEMHVKNIQLYGDAELLKSSFINLIDNARKASEENSIIKFTGNLTGDTYEFTVQDFGIGISKEHLSRICDEFYMVDKSRSRREGGAGLGLSLANLVFRCHNAKFLIESEPGKGTTMRVCFSIYPESGSTKKGKTEAQKEVTDHEEK